MLTLYAAPFIGKQTKALIFIVTKPTQKVHARARKQYLKISV